MFLNLLFQPDKPTGLCRLLKGNLGRIYSNLENEPLTKVTHCAQYQGKGAWNIECSSYRQTNVLVCLFVWDHRNILLLYLSPNLWSKKKAALFVFLCGNILICLESSWWCEMIRMFFWISSCLFVCVGVIKFYLKLPCLSVHVGWY